MKRLVIVFAACGDNFAVPTPDAASCGDAACIVPCTAVLSGNVDERTASPDLCPILQLGAGASAGHRMLDFLVPSEALGTKLGVRIDLGPAPTPGSYSSETTAIWSAIAIRSVPVHGACVYTAGSTSTPSGSFTLDVGAFETPTAHGALALAMFVLPRTTEQGVQTDCGPGSTENLDLHF